MSARPCTFHGDPVPYAGVVRIMLYMLYSVWKFPQAGVIQIHPPVAERCKRCSETLRTSEAPSHSGRVHTEVDAGYRLRTGFNGRLPPYDGAVPPCATTGWRFHRPPATAPFTYRTVFRFYSQHIRGGGQMVL